jgi:hypothetical protein
MPFFDRGETLLLKLISVNNEVYSVAFRVIIGIV